MPNILSANGTFDPFGSPRAEGGLGWEKAGKSCAVVGSSPRMLGRKFGNDIDAHDAVIRFNTATVKGFEADLGSRTDVRIAGKNRLFYEDCGEIVFNVWMKRYSMATEVSRLLPMEPVYYLKVQSPACTKLRVLNGGNRWKGHAMSSGFHGICFALDLCEHIDVYGFDDPNKKGVFPKKYHLKSYYDVCPGAKLGICPRSKHPWKAEYRSRKRLKEEKRLCLANASTR